MRSCLTNRSALGSAGRDDGFTLLEVMITVMLVGVLLAVGFPSYKAHRDKVLSRQAAQEIAQIGTIASNYWVDARAYPDSLAQIGMPGRLDPWGQPYVYYNVDANGRGGARKDHATNPINTDFDLYSMGPDGQTQPQITQKSSVDDVIRARNGGFVGTAADY